MKPFIVVVFNDRNDYLVNKVIAHGGLAICDVRGDDEALLRRLGERVDALLIGAPAGATDERAKIVAEGVKGSFGITFYDVDCFEMWAKERQR